MHYPNVRLGYQQLSQLRVVRTARQALIVRERQYLDGRTLGTLTQMPGKMTQQWRILLQKLSRPHAGALRLTLASQRHGAFHEVGMAQKEIGMLL